MLFERSKILGKCSTINSAYLVDHWSNADPESFYLIALSRSLRDSSEFWILINIQIYQSIFFISSHASLNFTQILHVDYILRKTQSL